MKKLTVSIGNLGSAAAGDYVSFNIWQGKRLLLSDQMTGKHSGVFHREYDVDYIQGEPLRVESNTPVGCSVGVNAELSNDEMAASNASAVFGEGLEIGAELKNSDTSTPVGFSAQQFAFYNPVNGKMDLFMYMKDRQIFMNEAFINKAWLNDVVVTDKMQSENYAPGESGFSLDYSTGKAEMNGKIVIRKPSGEPACIMWYLGEDSKTLEQRVAELEKRLAAEQEVASLRDKISEAIRSSSRRFQ